MKIKEILESATAGATSSASIATVPNPHLSPGKARGKKSYTGSPWTGSGTKSPPQPKPKKQKPTDNALDMKTSLFGEGNVVRRQEVGESQDPNLAKAYRLGLEAYKAYANDSERGQAAYNKIKTKFPQYAEMWMTGWNDGERFAKEGTYESKLLNKLNKLVENLDSAEYNDEAGMAENNLHTLARAIEGLLDTIKSNDNLPEWVQEKIAKAEMILVTVWDYLLSQKAQGIDPEVR